MAENEGWQSRVAEDARRHRELHERLSRLSISETSRDGAVRVTVSSTGLLTGLALAEPARPATLADLAAQVMDCVRRAQARIPDLLRQAMSESVGTGDATSDLLVDEARQRFPEPPTPKPEQRTWQPDEIRFSVPETPPAATVRPAPAPPPRARVHEETWDEQRPILEDVN
jgi:YbaB/EbfC DNA-binding family